jgi:hypothetical protein
MISTRFTPRTVLILMASEAVLLAGLIILTKVGLITRHPDVEDLIALGFGALARGMALVLFLQIADEYRSVRLTRLAWQALAIHAALIYSRGLISSHLMNNFIENYYSSPWRGFLNHLLGSLSSVLLLLGVVGILKGYRRAGLGPKPTAPDYLVMTISLVLFGCVLSFRTILEEGQSPWTINRVLQPLDLCLVAAASIVSIVLYRYAASMSGGKMAAALRWLVVYGMGPGVLVLLLQLIVPAIHDMTSVDLSQLNRLWALLPWMLTIAAAVRAEMTVHAVSQVARQQQNRIPAREAIPSGLGAGH